MELWIRSQDKETLTKVNSICIVEHGVQVEIRAEIYGIFSRIATYETKERAIQILNEIQEKMYNLASCNYHDGYYSRLYEMPKE